MMPPVLATSFDSHISSLPKSNAPVNFRNVQSAGRLNVHIVPKSFFARLKFSIKRRFGFGTHEIEETHRQFRTLLDESKFSQRAISTAFDQHKVNTRRPLTSRQVRRVMKQLRGLRESELSIHANNEHAVQQLKKRFNYFDNIGNVARGVFANVPRGISNAHDNPHARFEHLSPAKKQLLIFRLKSNATTPFEAAALASPMKTALDEVEMLEDSECDKMWQQYQDYREALTQLTQGASRQDYSALTANLKRLNDAHNNLADWGDHKLQNNFGVGLDGVIAQASLESVTSLDGEGLNKLYNGIAHPESGLLTLFGARGVGVLFQSSREPLRNFKASLERVMPSIAQTLQEEEIPAQSEAIKREIALAKGYTPSQERAMLEVAKMTATLKEATNAIRQGKELPQQLQLSPNPTNEELAHLMDDMGRSIKNAYVTDPRFKRIKDEQLNIIHAKEAAKNSPSLDEASKMEVLRSINNMNEAQDQRMNDILQGPSSYAEIHASLSELCDAMRDKNSASPLRPQLEAMADVLSPDNIKAVPQTVTWEVRGDKIYGVVSETIEDASVYEKELRGFFDSNTMTTPASGSTPQVCDQFIRDMQRQEVTLTDVDGKMVDLRKMAMDNAQTNVSAAPQALKTFADNKADVTFLLSQLLTQSLGNAAAVVMGKNKHLASIVMGEMGKSSVSMRENEDIPQQGKFVEHLGGDEYRLTYTANYKIKHVVSTDITPVNVADASHRDYAIVIDVFRNEQGKMDFKVNNIKLDDEILLA